jgi:putative FmdB family regulatory protein
MPVYEYECNKCGRKFEEFQPINDEPLKICNECGGDVIRLISKTNMQIDVGVCTGGAHEYYERFIKPDVKRIVDKIKSGDENAAADIFGNGEK